MNRTERAFWYRWILANALGETLGLGGAFGVGYAVMAALGEPVGAIPALLRAALAVGLGTLEGVVVGCAQGWVLRGWLPDLSRQRWVIATAAGAFFAWTLGMLPSTLMDFRAPTNASPPAIPDALIYLLAAGLGLVAGPILALAQWLVLRRVLERAWRWIPANALAWMIGMPVIFIGPNALPEGAPAWRIGLTIGAVVMAAGAVVGAIHGYALIRFLRPARSIEPSD
jgi:hypothetical protein